MQSTESFDFFDSPEKLSLNHKEDFSPKNEQTIVQIGEIFDKIIENEAKEILKQNIEFEREDYDQKIDDSTRIQFQSSNSDNIQEILYLPGHCLEKKLERPQSETNFLSKSELNIENYFESEHKVDIDLVEHKLTEKRKLIPCIRIYSEREGSLEFGDIDQPEREYMNYSLKKPKKRKISFTSERIESSPLSNTLE